MTFAYQDQMKVTHMVTIKKIHMLWALMLAIMGPTAAGVSAYYNLAPKAEVAQVRDKVDRIAEDVAEMKGILKQMARDHR